jgi:hypothetical protein
LRLVVQQKGTEAWHVQLHQTGLNLSPDQAYNVQFWARSSTPRTINVHTKLNRAPWRFLGLNENVSLTPQWRHYNLNFVADRPEPNASRLTFIVGQAVGDVWFADVVLRPGFVTDLAAGQTLEAGNIQLPLAGMHPQGQDFVTFLMEVESRYVADMSRYVKETLGSKALVSCSQANFGGLAGVAREAATDFVDTHGYWQHPQFPHRPWDSKDWVIANTPLVADPSGGTLPRLAMHRVEGKPFTVTEYNHPAPSDYSAETLPLLASYAAWQDWDGIFLFDYTGDRGGFRDEFIKGFFATDTHPGKIALMPAAAQLFLRGDLAPATQKLTLDIPRQQLATLTNKFNSQPNIWDSLGYRGMPNLWETSGAKPLDLIRSRVSIRLTDGGELKLTRTGTQDVAALQWSTSPAQAALFSVNAAKSKVVVGAPATATTLGGLRIEAGPTAHNFFALALCAMDDKAVEQSGSLLLTAVGDVENTGMVWNATRTSVGDQWGKGPTIAEGIPAEIALRTDARQAKVYALDGTGARLKSVPSQLKEGRLSFHIGPEYQTLWYEITTEP